MDAILLNKATWTNNYDFLGIFPSQSTQERLNQEAKNLSKELQTEVRILAPEVLHLTVKFIGNIDETQLNNLTAAFLQATGNLPSASLQINQFMLFPSRRKPRLVAADIERSSELDCIFQFCKITDSRNNMQHLPISAKIYAVWGIS